MLCSPAGAQGCCLIADASLTSVGQQFMAARLHSLSVGTYPTIAQISKYAVVFVHRKRPTRHATWTCSILEAPGYSSQSPDAYLHCTSRSTHDRAPCCATCLRLSHDRWRPAWLHSFM